MDSTALVVVAEGKKITVSCLEITDSCAINPEEARLVDLGDVVLDGAETRCIESLSVLKVATVGWCFAASDSDGEVALIFINVEPVSSSDDQPSLRAIFRHYDVFRCRSPMRIKLQASSVDLFATLPIEGKQGEVTVWSAAPRSIPSGAT